MRRYLGIVILFLLGTEVLGQVTDTLTGVVSYRNTQNVYVKFNNTSHISNGDTLFVLQEGNLIPALVVGHTSSLSVVGTPIGDIQLSVSDKVVCKSKPAKEESPPSRTEVPEGIPTPVEVPVTPEPEDEVSSKENAETAGFKENIH